MIRPAHAIVLLALGVSTPAAAGPLPAGSYAGTARWIGANGARGSYTVERTFNGNVLTNHYEWTGSKQTSETHRVTFALKSGDPFFEVMDDKNKVVGKGFCYENACSYTVNTATVRVEEMFRFGNGLIEVIGAKSGPGFAVAWKEDLKLK
jgi:hypothetical protein